jgi:hypothetical protein
MALQLGGEPFHDTFDVRLDQVIVEADIPPELHVRLGSAVGHLDDQAIGAASGSRAQHQRNGRPTGNEVGMHSHLQHPQPALPVMLPKRLVPLGVSVTAEDVIDQYVKAAAFALDGGEEVGEGLRIFVVDHESRTRAASGTN